MMFKRILTGWLVAITVVGGIAAYLVVRHDVRQAKRAKASVSISLTIETRATARVSLLSDLPPLLRDRGIHTFHSFICIAVGERPVE